MEYGGEEGGGFIGLIGLGKVTRVAVEGWRDMRECMVERVSALALDSIIFPMVTNVRSMDPVSNVGARTVAPTVML